MTNVERKVYPKWRATVRSGKIIIENDEAFQRHLIPYEGRDMIVIVRPYFKDRSRQEEKYYHAVVVEMIAEAMEITHDEAHNFLRSMFLKVEERSGDGKYRYERIMSTTELNDKAYREYWQKCVRWAALPTDPNGLGPDSGLELYISEPNEIDYESWNGIIRV